MNRRRKEVASKSEIEFRLAKLNWYLRRLEEWAKLTHDFCEGPMAASSTASCGEQASLLLSSYQLGALRVDAPIGRRLGREGRYAAVDTVRTRVVSGPGIKPENPESPSCGAILRHREPTSGSIGRIRYV
jgi:hypothetical protein